MLFSVALVAVAVARAEAAELVIFEADGCAISEKFHREMGASYTNIKGSRIFRLRRVNIGKNGTGGVVLEKPITMTPTFVFVDKGAEIARFTGYPGRKPFEQLIDVAADALLESGGAQQ